MIDAIIKELKKTSLKTWVPFPSTSATIPYGVVKEEPEPGLNRTVFRVIVHMKQSDAVALRRFVRRDVLLALQDKVLTSTDFGNRNQVFSSDNVGGIIVGNDDKTISMERLFYVQDIF